MCGRTIEESSFAFFNLLSITLIRSNDSIKMQIYHHKIKDQNGHPTLANYNQIDPKKVDLKIYMDWLLTDLYTKPLYCPNVSKFGLVFLKKHFFQLQNTQGHRATTKSTIVPATLKRLSSVNATDVSRQIVIIGLSLSITWQIQSS